MGTTNVHAMVVVVGGRLAPPTHQASGTKTHGDCRVVAVVRALNSDPEPWGARECLSRVGGWLSTDVSTGKLHMQTAARLSPFHSKVYFQYLKLFGRCHVMSCPSHSHSLHSPTRPCTSPAPAPPSQWFHSLLFPHQTLHQPCTIPTLPVVPLPLWLNLHLSPTTLF